LILLPLLLMLLLLLLLLMLLIAAAPDAAAAAHTTHTLILYSCLYSFSTVAWQAPILQSTMPTFLQFKLINSAYTMYTNALLNKGGHFR
jgi:hypothetical protein